MQHYTYLTDDINWAKELPLTKMQERKGDAFADESDG